MKTEINSQKTDLPVVPRGVEIIASFIRGNEFFLGKSQGILKLPVCGNPDQGWTKLLQDWSSTGHPISETFSHSYVSQ